MAAAEWGVTARVSGHRNHRCHLDTRPQSLDSHEVDKDPATPYLSYQNTQTSAFGVAHSRIDHEADEDAGNPLMTADVCIQHRVTWHAAIADGTDRS
jgi:hypothetical protein